VRSPKGLMMLAALALFFAANVWGACPDDPDCKWVEPSACGTCASDEQECGIDEECSGGTCRGKCSTDGITPCVDDDGCPGGLCTGDCGDAALTDCWGDYQCDVCVGATPATGSRDEPYCNINQAYRSPLTAPGDTIYVGPGTYKQCVDISPEGLSTPVDKPVHLLARAYDNSGLDGDIARTVIDGTDLCLLDEPLEDSTAVVRIEGSGSEGIGSSMKGFTVTGGEASGIFVSGGTVTISHNRIIENSGVEGAGINILTDACAPTYGNVSTIIVSNNTIKNNHAEAEPQGFGGDNLGHGGGIWGFVPEPSSTACNSVSTVEIKNNVIARNTIKNQNLDGNDRYLAKGGGIWVSTAMEPGGTALVQITDNEISNNGPVDGATFSTGGGIFAHTRTDGYGTETIEIRGNTIGPGNQAKEGGGLAAWAISPLPDNPSAHHIAITKNEILNNLAFSLPDEGVGGGGGASLRLEAFDMRPGEAVSIDFSQNVVAGNVADSTDGGGIRASVLSERSATAAARPDHPTPADKIEMTLRDNIIRNNTAQIGGGGAILSILADSDPRNPADEDCVFASCDSSQIPASVTIDFTRNLVTNNQGFNVGGEYQEVGAGILTIPTTIGEADAIINIDDSTIAGNTIGTDVGSSGGVETLVYVEPDCHLLVDGSITVSMDRAIVDGNEGYGLGSTLISYCLDSSQVPPDSLATPVTNSYLYDNPSGALNPTFPTTPENSPQTDPQLTGAYAPAACSPAFDLKVCDGTTTTCSGDGDCTHPATCVTGVGFHGNPDIAPDLIIDGLDMLDLAVAFNSTDAPDARYSEAADTNHNGVVDGEDLSYMGTQFGQVCLP